MNNQRKTFNKAQLAKCMIMAMLSILNCHQVVLLKKIGKFIILSIKINEHLSFDS